MPEGPRGHFQKHSLDFSCGEGAHKPLQEVVAAKVALWLCGHSLGLRGGLTSGSNGGYAPHHCRLLSLAVPGCIVGTPWVLCVAPCSGPQDCWLSMWLSDDSVSFPLSRPEDSYHQNGYPGYKCSHQAVPGLRLKQNKTQNQDLPHYFCPVSSYSFFHFFFRKT